MKKCSNKACQRADELLELDEFYKCKNGYDHQCKACRKKYYKKNSKKIQARAAECRKNINYVSPCRIENPDYMVEWRKKHPDYWRKWRKSHLGYYNKYKNNIYKSNPMFRLNTCVSRAIYQSLKDKKRGRNWEQLVGYTLAQLKEHLEKLFKPGMSWDNYGEWHLDHIIPVKLWEYSDYTDIEFRQCWSRCNFQPLWAQDNFIKGSRMMIFS